MSTERIEYPNGWTLRIHPQKGGHSECTLIITAEPQHVGCLSSAATNVDVETFKREVAELPAVLPKAPKAKAGGRWLRRGQDRREARRAARGLPPPRKGR